MAQAILSYWQLFKAKYAALRFKLILLLPFEISKAEKIQHDYILQQGTPEQAHGVPDYAPNFTLPNQDGEPVELYTLLEKGPVIISFYRGKWCPFCNLELRSLQRQLEQFRELGATLLAISPQTVEVTNGFAQSIPVQYEVLADVGFDVARSFGLVYNLSADYVDAMAAVGVNFSDYYGGTENSSLYPIPATYIIAQDRKITYAYVNPDVSRRASGAELIHVLRELRQQPLTVQ